MDVRYFIAGFICFCTTQIQSRSLEPTCSKFDYELKTLEKVVRFEHAMELFEERQEAWQALLDSKVEEIARLERKLEEKASTVEEGIAGMNRKFDVKTQEMADRISDDLSSNQRILNATIDTMQETMKSIPNKGMCVYLYVCLYS